MSDDGPRFGGPLFDPRMELPGVPDDWRVLWCPGCGYAVTWDREFEVTDDDPGFVVWQEAAPHACPAEAPSNS